ncbi:MAG: creatininase family protein, partial [Terriglobia bacterium]
LQETTDEMARNGCKKIIIANGHGGNTLFLPYFAQTQLASPHDYMVYIFPLPDLARPGRPALKHRHDGHSGEVETSHDLVSCPNLMHMDKANTETWRALHRLHLPKGVFTAISWYSNFPNHYAGDGSAGNKALGEFDMKTWIGELVGTIRAVKADNESLKLQNEFYEKARHPLQTPQVDVTP